MKGIPNRNMFGSSSFKTPTLPNRSVGSVRNPTRPTIPGVRRDGGIKLLDIGEQPLGRDTKRKKRDPKEENAKQKDGEKGSTQDQSSTPDYALGLTSLVPPSPAPSYSVPPTPEPPNSNDYAPMTPIKSTSMNSPMTSVPTRTYSTDSNPEEEGTETATPTKNFASDPSPPPPIVPQIKQSQPNPVHVTQIAFVPKQTPVVRSLSIFYEFLWPALCECSTLRSKLSIKLSQIFADQIY